jgi:hypothetical protein
MTSAGHSEAKHPVRNFLQWAWLVGLSFTLYFLCFYMFRSDFVCGQSEMIRCDDTLANRFASIQALEAVGIFGSPGLFAVFLARKSPVFQLLWHIPFVLWTVYTFNLYTRSALTIDGRHGCEYCDFAIFFMLVVGVLALPHASRSPKAKVSSPGNGPA